MADRHERQRSEWKSRAIVLRRSCAFRKARKSRSPVVRNSDSRKIETDQPGTESGDRRCQSIGDGAWFPAFLRTGRGRCRRSGDWLGSRPLVVDVAIRPHRVFAAWLRRRRSQRGEVGGRSLAQTLRADGKSRHLKFDCRPGRWIKSRADENRPDPPVQHRAPLHDRPYRRARDRLHQLIPLHVPDGGGDLAADDRRHGGTAAGARAACSRSPKSPTNSSPTRCARPPARKA